MSVTVSEKLDANRLPKKPFGLKSKHTINRITLNPSSANPGEKLYVDIPKLSENVVLVPRTIKLVFNLTESGHANNKFVNNFGRALVRSMKVIFGGEVLQDTQRYDLIKLYEDYYKNKEEYYDLLSQGVSGENMRKLRANAGDKSTSNASKVALAAVHNNRYTIPLDHPILNDHGVLYLKALPDTLRFELTLAPVGEVVEYSSNTPEATYKMTNLELEYGSIHSEYLAGEAASGYQVGTGFFYENIILHKEFTISKPNDSVINESINIPRRSMTGILCLFTESYNAGARDPEKFVNPNITSVDITIDGMPNQLYSKGIVAPDLWESIKRRLPGKAYRNAKEVDFYTNDKFALWIDLRSHFDNDIHDSGFFSNSSHDGVKLLIKRVTGGSGNITCYMFVVADALMELLGSRLKSILD